MEVDHRFDAVIACTVVGGQHVYPLDGNMVLAVRPPLAVNVVALGEPDPRFVPSVAGGDAVDRVSRINPDLDLVSGSDNQRIGTAQPLIQGAEQLKSAVLLARVSVRKEQHAPLLLRSADCIVADAESAHWLTADRAPKVVGYGRRDVDNVRAGVFSDPAVNVVVNHVRECRF